MANNIEESFRKRVIHLSCGLLLVALAAGCGPISENSREAISHSAPTSFDACRDIAASTLADLNLLPNPTSLNSTENGVEIIGCKFPQSSASKTPTYPQFVEIGTTNMTAEYFSRHGDNSQNDTKSPRRDFTIGSRKAASRGPIFVPSESAEQHGCKIVMDIPDGGIYLYTAESNADPCSDIEKIASKLDPLLPPLS